MSTKTTKNLKVLGALTVTIGVGVLVVILFFPKIGKKLTIALKTPSSVSDSEVEVGQKLEGTISKDDINFLVNNNQCEVYLTTESGERKLLAVASSFHGKSDRKTYSKITMYDPETGVPMTDTYSVVGQPGEEVVTYSVLRERPQIATKIVYTGDVNSTMKDFLGDLKLTGYKYVSKENVNGYKARHYANKENGGDIWFVKDLESLKDVWVITRRTPEVKDPAYEPEVVNGEEVVQTDVLYKTKEVDIEDVTLPPTTKVLEQGSMNVDWEQMKDLSQ